MPLSDTSDVRSNSARAAREREKAKISLGSRSSGASSLPSNLTGWKLSVATYIPYLLLFSALYHDDSLHIAFFMAASSS